MRKGGNMKKFSIFITVLLIILIVSLIFVLQNSATVVSLKFFGWTFPTVSVGLLTVIMFFAGFVVMWLIALMFYIGSSASYRRELKSRDKIIKQLQREKKVLESKLKDRDKELETFKKQVSNKLQTTTEETTGQAKDNSQESIENKVDTTEQVTSSSKTSNDVKEEDKKPKRRGLFGRR